MVSNQVYLALCCCLVFVIFLTFFVAFFCLKVGSIVVVVSRHEFDYCGRSLLFFQLFVAIKLLLVSLLMMLVSVNHHWSFFSSLWFFADWLEKLCLLTDLLHEGVCKRTMTSDIHRIISTSWQQLRVLSWLLRRRPAHLHRNPHVNNLLVFLVSHHGGVHSSLHLMLLLWVCLQLRCKFSDFYHIFSVFMRSLNAQMNFAL